MSDQNETPSHTSPFEQIRHEDPADGEYWSARELAPVLGYVQWRNFVGVIKQARTACENSGQSVSDHFADVSKMVTLGSGAQRKIADVLLSRYACYLVVQNGDPEKPVIAAGQTYFAIQTRRQQLADELGDELASLTEEQKRLYTRAQMADHNKLLAAAANTAGVTTPQDFALFHDHGYGGLYGGLTQRMIHARKRLKAGQHILDWMNSSELAANLFRATQTEELIRRDPSITTKAQANAAHHAVGAKVRQTIAELGGTMPENQPTPEHSIKQVQRQELKRIDGEQQPSLFDEPEH